MKILIADDDTTSRLLLGASLKKLGHAVTAVENGRLALEAWRRERHALLISDWMMPELDGLELCRQVRAEPALDYTYIVLLTSLSGKRSYLEGMQAGADDFLSKPYDEDYLAARLHVAARILALHAALRAEATHDRLTGLWNRGAILDGLAKALADAARGNAPVGVVIADLDHFKAVNDGHGHAAGDGVLRETARRIQACLGPGDRVGRYGGEEFLVVATGGDAARLQALAEAIRASIADAPMANPSAPLAVTASLGVALAQGGAVQDAEALIAAADAALYRAKLAGRNRVFVAA